MQKLNTILLIDDDPINNYIVERLFNTLCICDKIIKYKNGKEALFFLTGLCKSHINFPDLILLDINMPVMNGFEFLTELKAIQPELFSSVVILSNSSYHKDAETLNKLGITKVLRKPIKREHVISLLSDPALNQL